MYDHEILFDLFKKLQMRIQNTKAVSDLTDQSLFKKYPDIPWGEIKGMRNIVVHDYFNIDAEEIFNTCKEDIPKLAQTVGMIISDLKAEQ